MLFFCFVSDNISLQLMEVELVFVPSGTDVLELTFFFSCSGSVTRFGLGVHLAALIESLGIQFTCWLF